MRIVIIAALLTGCASMPKAPEVVYVPTYVPCIGTVPTKPEKAIPANDSVSEQVRALLIELERMKVYEAELEAVIAGCL